MRTTPLLLSVPIAFAALGFPAMAASSSPADATPNAYPNNYPNQYLAKDNLPLDILWPAADGLPDALYTQSAPSAAAVQGLADNDQLQPRESASAVPPYELRSGNVMLDTPAFSQAGLAPRASRQAGAPAAPRWLRLGLFPDTQIEVEITSQTNPAQGVLAINGRAPDSDFASFSMTVTPASYLITFADPDSSKLYRVVGDSATGQGRVTEIDRAKIPPQIHESPRVPPQFPSQFPSQLPSQP